MKRSINLSLGIVFLVILFLFSCSSNKDDSVSFYNGMQLKEYLELKGSTEPDAKYTYGNHEAQFVHFYLPKGNGPFPVVVAIHGGCWTKEYQGINQLAPLAEALKSKGYAVLNIQYRCINEEGGGYPGTYLDVSNAIKQLTEIGEKYPIDLKRIAYLGHSAGGHLAQWAASIETIPNESTLYINDPFKAKLVIALGSIADLRVADKACPNINDLGGVAKLLKDETTASYKETSPIDMLPLNTPTVMITGGLDDISLPEYANSFKEKAGANVKVIIVNGTTHYDEVSVKSSVFPHIIDELSESL